MSTQNIHLSAALSERLEAVARANGVEVVAFVETTLLKHLEAEHEPHARSSIARDIPLPASIRQRVEVLAREDGVEVDSFIATVLSQRVAVADADSYVRRRATRGSAEQMLDILSQAPQVAPEANDRLES